jgi:hypothetical protein
MASYDEKRQLCDRMLTTFRAAAQQRGDRADLVDTPTGPELGWVLHERAEMLAVVNQARADRGQPPADPAAVLQAEQNAAGHSDYAAKYALYCVEIILDERPLPRITR